MLRDYLKQPEYVMGIGYIYPVTISNIEEFREISSRFLILGKTTIKNRLKTEVEYLLDFYLQGVENFIEEFKRLLKLVLHKEVKFIIKEDNKDYAFRVDEEDSSFEVNKYNFDIFRDIVMRQNLLNEPLTEEDDLMQEWLELARETKLRGLDNIDIESICQLLALVKGLNPEDLANYSYYQVMAEYSRLSLVDSQQYIMLLRSQGVEEPLPVTSKVLNLYENPDNDLIKTENIKSSGDI